MATNQEALCNFDIAWVGKCRESVPCVKHAGRKCSSCHAAATRECGETGQFVCGADLCDDCEHAIFPDGTNGGIGFNAQVLPTGTRRHCKKTEQRHQPWYARS